MSTAAKEYGLAREVQNTLRRWLQPEFSAALTEDIVDLAQQDDALIADAKVNDLVILVSVQPPVAEPPSPIGRPNRGAMRAQIAISIAAREQYGGAAGCSPHETVCAAQDAVMSALVPVYLNGDMDNGLFCAAVESVLDLSFSPEELQNTTGRRIILGIPFSY